YYERQRARQSGLFYSPQQERADSANGRLCVPGRLTMKTAATLFILFSSLQLASAQVPQELQERPVLDSFHRSIDELNSRFGIKQTPAGFHADAIQALKKISQHVEVLEFVIGSQKQMPKEYLDGIGLDAELLKRLARQE